MIKVEHLRKEFALGRRDGKLAVDDVEFEVNEGEFFTLLGPSGCGKTTTLRCIAGLERPTSGLIKIDGQAVYDQKVLVPTSDRNLGMVFQSYAVWPHMSVFNNVAFPLTVARKRPQRAEIRSRVEAILALVGLEGLERRMATQLSGGQQQRLSLARALVGSPRVLLLDEPLSNLDAKLRERMRSELREIQRRVGITTLFVTHDQIEALSMSDRIAVMRDGRIVQLATPSELYHRPASAFVAHFIGGTNLVGGTVVAVHGDDVTIDTAAGPLRGVQGGRGVGVSDLAMASIRLEDVVVDAGAGSTPVTDANILRGTIGHRVFNGASVDYRLNIEGLELHARLSSRSDLPMDTAVTVRLPRDYIRVLPLDDESLLDPSRHRRKVETAAVAGGGADSR